MAGPDGRPGDGFVLGVDLGTSHTVAMLRWPDGRTRPLLFDGQPLLPSAVYLDTTGRLHVGRDALRFGYAEPGRIEPNPKRHIDDASVLLGGAEVPVPDLLSSLLGAVAAEAVAATGFLPPAVLTYPAAWGPQRRAVLVEAIARAGWPKETRLVPEPVAAARYFSDVLRRPVPAGAALAVFDFGGGTVDIAVVRNEGPGPDGHSQFVVAASGGIDDLGGLDLDAALVEHVGKALAGAEPEAWKALTEPVTLAQWRARRQFWEDVRGAKEMLSRAAFAPVPVPGVEHAVQLTRDELEATAGPLVHRAVNEAGAVIRAAGLTPRELAGLFLVGGSSRVPLVSRMLHNELGIAPTALEQPELPVAEGAIIAGPTAQGVESGAAARGVESGSATRGVESGSAARGVESGSAARGVESGAAAREPLTPHPPTADTLPAAEPRQIVPRPDPVSGSPAQAPAPRPQSPAPAQAPASAPTPERLAPASAPTPERLAPASAPTPERLAPASAPASERPAPVSGRPAPAPAPVPEQRNAEPQYAEPVDPWATGEAAAFAGMAGGHESWLASTDPDPDPAGPGRSESGAASGRGSRAYKKKVLWLVGACAVVVVAVAATLTVVFWPKYPALDFQAVGDAKLVTPALPLGSGYTAAVVHGDRAYFAGVDDKYDDADKLGIVATDAATGGVLWTNPDVGTVTKWEQVLATPEVVVAISARDYDTDTRQMTVLDADKGKPLWNKVLGGDDNVMFTGDVVVWTDKKGFKVRGLDVRRGSERWTFDNPTTQYGQRAAAVIRSTTVDDYAGPSSTVGTALSAPLDDDTRIVIVGSDRSAHVIDADTGKESRKLDNVADPDDEIVAHNGRLIVAESETVPQLVAYDLAKGGDPKLLYKAKAAGVRMENLTPCGPDRVCVVATTSTTDAEVVAVNAADTGQLWARKLLGVDALVPVGDSVLAVQDTPQQQATLLNQDGSVAWAKPGEFARLDAANLLEFTKPLSTSANQPALRGLHLGDAAVELGPLKDDERSASCSWNTEVIACAGEDKFEILKFVS